MQIGGNKTTDDHQIAARHYIQRNNTIMLAVRPLYAVQPGSRVGFVCWHRKAVKIRKIFEFS
ncbi:unnamed protein product [Callosobruchus maculatus]|uniref:Uncharacterized protein n=1 Tax=Callosobruchus maculatus TaxID=64391 RepID=A0A653DH75_CALMS|nr:unnamed protein product [Callosobruchus maculatus]